MESLYKSSFRIQLVVKTKPRRDIFPLGLYIYRLSIFHFFFSHDYKAFSLIFQILKALTNTCFNMHILFSNQSYSISSPTVLYCYNHMYRTLTYPELLRSLSHRRTIFYNIVCDFHRPLLNIISHGKAPASFIFYNLCRGLKMYV